MGGDEFAVLLIDLEDASQIPCICTRILESLKDRIYFNGKEIGTSPTLGVAFFPDHGETWHELYKAADIALYTAKRAGRARWECYRPEQAVVSKG